MASPSLLVNVQLPQSHHHQISSSSSDRPPTGKIVKRTAGILAPADLDELLDIGDFGRHLG
jgi:hypothetical protein